MTAHITIALLLATIAGGDHSGSSDTSDYEAQSVRLLLDGYCPVTVVDENRWQKGDERFTTEHGGCTYLFAGEEELKEFLKSPEGYGVAMSGYDVVQCQRTGELIDGKRNFGVHYGTIYLFANERNRGDFESDPQRYADAAREWMAAQSTQRSSLVGR